MKMLTGSKFGSILAIFVVALLGTGLLLTAASLNAGAEETKQSRAGKPDKSKKMFLRVEKDASGNTVQSTPVSCEAPGNCYDEDCCARSHGECTKCYVEAPDSDYARKKPLRGKSRPPAK